MQIVIVGNGVAGMEAALTVRKRQPDWKITLVSEESDHFFSRTALMYVVAGQLAHKDIEPLERDTYERLGFTRVRARAVGVNTEAREVLLAGGLPPLPYDRLLLATGSRPRPAPFWSGYGALRGIGHLVTLQDIDWLSSELYGQSTGAPERPKAHLEATSEGSPYGFRSPASASRGPAKRGVVIGGGLIGIEAVETLLAAGIKPTFIIREEWFWPMAIDAAESRWITERMRDHGVDVRLEHNVQGFEGDGQGNVAKVLTDHGAIEADVVVVAIGVVPNTDWLGESVARERGAIVVDAQLRTSAEGVLAAGDCAAVVWFDGVRRPEQLWYTGRDQGRVAGRVMLGDAVSYARGTWYNSAKLMDIEYTTAGLVAPGGEGVETFFYEERGSVRSTTRVVHRQGQVLGFNLLGRRWDHTVLLRWIEERRDLPYVLSRLNEARFDTEFVPKLRLPQGGC